MNKSFVQKRFRNIGVLTVLAVYFLILVGGIVRSTGSGMGCPDWPKCFGNWVPPTDVRQLPDNYLEIYKQKRIEKNQKLAGYLDKMGFDKVATSIFSHPSQYIETEFNVQKTWIEYVNRLVGVVIGFLIFLTVVYAVPYLKIDKTIFYLALASFIIVGVQGWLGSIVVSTNLLPETVTVHMALALVLIALLEYALLRSQAGILTKQLSYRSRINTLLLLSILVSFIQIMLGTQVREEVDTIAYVLGSENRAQWVEQLGRDFYVHRSLSIGILLLNVYLAYLLYQEKNQLLSKMAGWMLVVLFAEVVIGVVMAYFAIPASLQPLHLTLGTVLFGLQFYMFIFYRFASRGAAIKAKVAVR